MSVKVTDLLLAKTKGSEWIPHQNSKSNKMGENRKELDHYRREENVYTGDLLKRGLED
jgi:hypothetical protein